MRIRILFFFMILPCFLFAQVPCEISTNISDSLGTFKSTKEYLIYERNFAGKSAFMHFSLEKVNGTPLLNVEFVQRSKSFIKANCLDKNSRIYLQLDNGKIVTLIYDGHDNCGTGVRDDKGNSNRIMQGHFLFMKDSYAELLKSPVSVMRVRYATETVDYIFRPQFKAEFDGKIYEPQQYFMKTLPCIIN